MRAEIQCNAGRVPLPCHRRRGAMLVLIATMLVLILAFAALLLDMSWMALAKSELQSATDEACRAALMKYTAADADLSEAQRLQDARRQARDVFKDNLVGGRHRDVDPMSFVFGHASYSGVGMSAFVAHQKPYNAVQGNVLTSDPATQSVSLFMMPLFGVNDFSPTAEATVGLKTADIVLVVDASRSMTRLPHSPNKKSQRLYPQGGGARKPPLPGSRWSHMMDALDHFTVLMQEGHSDAWIGMASFGGGEKDYVPPNYPELEQYYRREYQLGPQKSGNYLSPRMSRYSDSPLGYGTDIAAGIQDAIAMLNAYGRSTAERYILLLSDGLPYAPGRQPTEEAVLDARDANITIHSVIFGLYDAGANAMMQDAADQTGGHFFGNATSGPELEQTFTDMVESFPVRLLD